MAYNINHKHLFHSGTAKKPVYLRSFLLGRIIKIVISSNLQRRPSIFKEFFAWKKNKDFFYSNLPSCLGHFLQFIICSLKNGWWWRPCRDATNERSFFFVWSSYFEGTHFKCKVYVCKTDIFNPRILMVDTLREA